MATKKIHKDRSLEDLVDIKWKELYLAGELEIKDVLLLKQIWGMRMTLKEIRNELAIMNGGRYNYRR